MVVIAIIAILIALLVPARRVIPRDYYEGRDQFQWAKVLESGDPPERAKAIEALCELMKKTPSKSSVRLVAAHALTNAKAIEAIPAIREMLQNDDEDLRSYAKRTLDELETVKKQ